MILFYQNLSDVFGDFGLFPREHLAAEVGGEAVGQSCGSFSCRDVPAKLLRQGGDALVRDAAGNDVGEPRLEGKFL